jgi:MarR family transcriptional regulator for hemolysin
MMKKDLARKLPVMTRGWRQLADATLAEFGVSNSMAWCLIYLDRLGPDARQTELALEIGISQPSTVRVLDQLGQAGLVERLRDPDDKRSNRLAITAKGTDLLDKIEERLAELRGALFDGIPDREIETVLKVVDLLSGRITEKRR